MLKLFLKFRNFEVLKDIEPFSISVLNCTQNFSRKNFNYDSSYNFRIDVIAMRLNVETKCTKIIIIDMRPRKQHGKIAATACSEKADRDEN